MAYTVDYSDSNRGAITVTDGTLNADTSIKLVGKNFYGYGEYVAENFLHLLENFSNSTAPTDPVRGQLWYNNSLDEWNYYDNNDAWVGFKAGGVQTVTLTDNSAVTHPAVMMSSGSTIIAILSDATSYTLASPGTGATLAARTAGFATIGKGMNLNPTNSSADFKLHGRATEAEYADLAEIYSSDSDYEPGTVLMIGGEAEVTQTTEAFSPDVFGIVSTNPAYLMNSKAEGVAVALEGRVPCKVIGHVRKGQRIVSSEEPGVARAVSDYERQESLDWYRIVGRALVDKTTEGVELIEVAVGIK